MKIIAFSLAFLMSIITVHSFAGEAPKAVSISKEQLSGKIFDGLPTSEFFGNKTQFADVYKSEDGKFSFGVFAMVVDKVENGITRYEDFHSYEFMYFLEGTMKLIDDDGNVAEAGPGEVLFIPKGWTGKRITNDIRKISVVYKDSPTGE